MPKRTRKPIQILQHQRTSGLFLAGGEYIADIKTDDGRRIRRKLGPEKVRALKLFDRIVEDLEDEGDNPRLAHFLLDRFLPTLTHLRAYEYAARCIDRVCRFLDAKHPDLKLNQVNRSHV
jgi:hypothetical protein